VGPREKRALEITHWLTAATSPRWVCFTVSVQEREEEGEHTGRRGRIKQEKNKNAARKSRRKQTKRADELHEVRNIHSLCPLSPFPPSFLPSTITRSLSVSPFRVCVLCNLTKCSQPFLVNTLLSGKDFHSLCYALLLALPLLNTHTHTHTNTHPHTSASVFLSSCTVFYLRGTHSTSCVADTHTHTHTQNRLSESTLFHSM